MLPDMATKDRALRAVRDVSRQRENATAIKLHLFASPFLQPCCSSLFDEHLHHSPTVKTSNATPATCTHRADDLRFRIHANAYRTAHGRSDRVSVHQIGWRGAVRGRGVPRLDGTVRVARPKHFIKPASYPGRSVAVPYAHRCD